MLVTSVTWITAFGKPSLGRALNKKIIKVKRRGGEISFKILTPLPGEVPELVFEPFSALALFVASKPHQDGFIKRKESS